MLQQFYIPLIRRATENKIVFANFHTLSTKFESTLETAVDHEEETNWVRLANRFRQKKIASSVPAKEVTLVENSNICKDEFECRRFICDFFFCSGGGADHRENADELRDLPRQD